MKLVRLSVLPALLCFGESAYVWADSQKEFQFGVYSSSIKYEEPGAMSEEGTLFGFLGRLSSHRTNSTVLFDLAYATGDMDYTGSGVINGVPDKMFEVRAMRGKDLFTTNYRVTPYIGFGYRNLNDNGYGLVSSTNAIFYEREQVYWYAPIGIEFKEMGMSGSWRLGGRFEYDYFLQGINHTYAGYIAGANDSTFHQNSGSGFRICLNVEKMLSSGVGIIVEPFYKYWHIQDSDYDYYVSNGELHGAWEPDNNSKELGVALLLSF